MEWAATEAATTFFQIVFTVKDNSRSTLSVANITVDVSDYNSFKTGHTSLERLSLGGLEF